MAKSPGGIIQDLQEQFGPAIAAAFERAMDTVRAGVDMAAMVAAIQRRDVEAAIAAMNLDAAALAALEDAVETTFREGGAGTAAALPKTNPQGVALAIRFNARNLRAEGVLRTQSASLVTNVIEQQVLAMRHALTDGMQRGENPTTTALDLVGRYDRRTGKREGGIIGLSAPQERYLANARAELEGLDSSYFQRERRDKRFDPTIRRAIESGQPIDPERIRKALDGYQRQLLKLRGDAIGRTEAMRALHQAQDEALRQAVESGKLPATSVRRIWRSSHDLRVRRTHVVLDGKSVGLDEAFKSPSGAHLMFPGDPTAPAEETINCRCYMQVRVDWFANLE